MSADETPRGQRFLDSVQSARVEAVNAAANRLMTRGSGLAAGAAPGDLSDIIRLARFILTGDDLYGVPDHDSEATA